MRRMAAKIAPMNWRDEVQATDIRRWSKARLERHWKADREGLARALAILAAPARMCAGPQKWSWRGGGPDVRLAGDYRTDYNHL